MIIGLTGKNGSGKGEVAKVLVEGGFEAFSLSDILREEMGLRGVEITRENLIEWGRRLRAEYGLDYLARRVAERFTLGLNQVVDSIRNPEEVKYLRSLGNFFLVLVEAPLEVRFARIQKRARPGDPTDLEEFRRCEERELISEDPAAQQLLQTFAMRDFVIENDSDLADLRAKVVKVFREAAKALKRPTWDEYFMKIAEVVASRSSCVKRRVAAVIVKDRRIISTGYNGTPRGTRNCNEGGCERCLSLTPSGQALHDCLCSHAEENAIVQAAYHGVVLQGATIYSTFAPCLICTKMIINAGISEVVYRSPYPLPPEAQRLLEEAKVKVRCLSNSCE